MLTNRKHIFLNFEYKNYYYNFFKSYNEFYNEMINDIVECSKCGIIYWKGCKKNCKCKKIGE